jgi:hypothetical protein
MSTIYRPTYLSPRNISVDMSVNQNFTCVVNGVKITDYQLIIYKNSDNTVLYDSTKTALGTPKYNGETLSITVTGGTVANGLELKYTIKYWNGTEEIISSEIFFTSASIATLTITVPNPVTTQSYEFVGTYTQAQSVPIKQWYYVLYDDNLDEIDRSPLSFSGNVRYTFEGFISGNSYKIKGFAETQDNVLIETFLHSFTTSYSNPTVVTQPTVTLLADKTAIQVDWGVISQISGVVSGTSSYISNFITVGNFGLQLNSGATLTYDIDTPEEYTLHFLWQPLNVDFTGDIVKLNNSITGEYCKVGYISGRFVKNVSDYSLPKTLTTNYFLISVRFNRVIIREFDSSTLLMIDKIII